MKNHLKALRAAHRMTQEELAQRVHVSRQSIVAIESGKYNPSLQLAFKLAHVFDCNIEDVFIFEEEVE